MAESNPEGGFLEEAAEFLNGWQQYVNTVRWVSSIGRGEIHLVHSAPEEARSVAATLRHSAVTFDAECTQEELIAEAQDLYAAIRTYAGETLGPLRVGPSSDGRGIEARSRNDYSAAVVEWTNAQAEKRPGRPAIPVDYRRDPGFRLTAM